MSAVRWIPGVGVHTPRLSVDYPRSGMTARPVTVTYHHDPGAWWAESDDLPGFTAVGDSLAEVRQYVREMADMLPYSVDLREQHEDGAPIVVARWGGAS